MKTPKLFLLTALIFGAVACQNDSAPYINVPESIVLISDESTITFTVSSNVDWTMDISDKWFKITPKQGKNDMTITLEADRNVTGAVRTSTIEFAYAEGTPVRVSVSQPAYTVNMTVEAPSSVVVKKGEQLTLSIETNVDDWSYSVTDGAWLKGVSAETNSLVFDLVPSVRFSTDIPAKIAFTSPSDPLFDHVVSILPVDFCEFSATAPESVEVEAGAQLKVNITSNIDDWIYKINNGGWLSELSKNNTEIVFSITPENLLDPSVKATIEFSSPSYANFTQTIEIQPISKGTVIYLADKSKMSVFVLGNDGVVSTAATVSSDYLFDGRWMVNKSDYTTSNIEGESFGYKHWELATSLAQAGEGHGDSFTIDAGENIKLAKFITYHYYDYTRNDPLVYEIYAYTGSQSEPEADWTNWTQLGSVDVTDVYPIVNALPSGSYSEHIANGDTLTIAEEDAIQARYYRFKMTQNGYAYGKGNVDQNWSGRIHYLTLSEVSLYSYR